MAAWEPVNKSRVSGAAGVLAEAAKAADEIVARGPCALTAAEIDDVIRLAESAAVLLRRVPEVGRWGD